MIPTARSLYRRDPVDQRERVLAARYRVRLMVDEWEEQKEQKAAFTALMTNPWLNTALSAMFSYVGMAMARRRTVDSAKVKADV